MSRYFKKNRRISVNSEETGSEISINIDKKGKI